MTKMISKKNCVKGLTFDLSIPIYNIEDATKGLRLILLNKEK